MMESERKNSALAVHERLVLALDMEDGEEALALVSELKDRVGLFKVGHQLFTACGPDIVRKIVERGGRVFLDLKFHDIPNTVAKASAEAVKLGVDMFNLHALGGLDMMKAAVASADEAAEKQHARKPLILAVTILTSTDERVLRRELKITRSVRREVCHLARLAKRAGMGGVVASPREIKAIRRTLRNEFVILTPGVRPQWAGKDDQKRVMTPAEAVAAGADYIVIGRPVLESENRTEAVEKILEEIGRRITEK